MIQGVETKNIILWFIQQYAKYLYNTQKKV